MRWSVSRLRQFFVRLVTQQWHRPESGLWLARAPPLGGFSATTQGALARVRMSRFTLGTDRFDPLLNRAMALQSRDGPHLLHFRYTTRNGTVTGILLRKVFQRQATFKFGATPSFEVAWELRTACDLARFWQGQSEARKARKLLRAVCNQFTEGFDTGELRSARACMDSLKMKTQGDTLPSGLLREHSS